MDDSLERMLSRIEADLHDRDVERTDALQRARANGREAVALDLEAETGRGDLEWARGRWDAARLAYRREAAAMEARRRWHQKADPESYPFDELSEDEATALTRGGLIREARDRVSGAIAYWRSEPGSELAVSRLGLHAAQLQLPDLAAHARAAEGVWAQLIEGGNEPTHRIRRELQYEGAQSALLLRDWDGFAHAVATLEEVQATLAQADVEPFPEALLEAQLSFVRGARGILDVRAGTSSGHEPVVAAFEDALAAFAEFNGNLSGAAYFMRLDARLVADLAGGRKPDPNPFADRDG